MSYGMSTDVLVIATLWLESGRRERLFTESVAVSWSICDEVPRCGSRDASAFRTVL